MDVDHRHGRAHGVHVALLASSARSRLEHLPEPGTCARGASTPSRHAGYSRRPRPIATVSRVSGGVLCAFEAHARVAEICACGSRSRTESVRRGAAEIPRFDRDKRGT